MIIHSPEQFLVEPKILIGKKFKDCFPLLKRRPNEFKLAVQSYENALKRLREDNYQTKGKKTQDLNLVESTQNRIDLYLYMSKFVLDGTGTIKNVKL